MPQTTNGTIRHESAIKEKTWKSLHSELDKRKSLTQCSWGSGGCCEPPRGSRAEPWWRQGGEAPRKFHLFSSKNALDWLILSLVGQLRYAKFFRPTAQPCLTIG